ncbi:hypothetical protein [Streptomyces sp. NBC_01465]|uniref:hypothetical protein n=1 Tax=Streptomyces sp. NBC_01465 TaxID=2903878 RepID=UPI002E373BBF|nr:hypothetical protein [Streptomyces sp. NBC_01465]
MQNGLDYLIDVIDCLAGGPGEVTPRRLKYAVLHLQAATEVLLKYRLYQEHWTLVLQNLDVSRANKNKKMSRDRFDRGDFVSCGPEETVERLRYLLGVPISDQEQEQIVALAKSRNALQHFGLTDSDGTIEVRTVEVLDFLIRFLDEQLLPNLDEAEREGVDDDVEHIRGGLRQIRTFVERRMERLKGQLEAVEERILECPDCRQWALQVGDPTSCLFCHTATDSQQAAWTYATYVLRLPWRSRPTTDVFSQPGTPPVDPCPECGTDTLVQGALTAAQPDRPTNFCFNCALAFPELCEICSQPFRAADEESICGSCLSLGSED